MNTTQHQQPCPCAWCSVEQNPTMTPETPRTDYDSFFGRTDENPNGTELTPAVVSRQLGRDLAAAYDAMRVLNERLIERREAYEAYIVKQQLIGALIDKVRLWGIDRQITGPNGKGTIAAQASKLREEANEVMDEIETLDSGDSLNLVMLEIGDVFVSAILLCDMLKLTPEQCLQAAYDKISQRAGQMIDGTFVKNDLAYGAAVGGKQP